MTRVTFYLLENSQQSAEQFACKLVEKAWRGGLPMHIHTEDESSCVAFDKLLWVWREDSFLPHGIVTGTADSEDNSASIDNLPITLGFDTPSIPQNRLLINLNSEVPQFFTQFNRVCEIVVISPGQKTISRNKFRSYRQLGIEPEVHNLPG
ncbi:DNA polymerase III subunit chi [Endozoicomonas ascidiicola]|uniref:DNA polymerase III subunit chi n=1 Tax=Endozoicomonas ascidiicola TaxID=1698521 RepID=UPI00082B3950|nr:DNA polymerase III subunit chi [Endozoicomonas ascidiicola]